MVSGYKQSKLEIYFAVQKMWLLKYLKSNFGMQY